MKLEWAESMPKYVWIGRSCSDIREFTVLVFFLFLLCSFIFSVPGGEETVRSFLLLYSLCVAHLGARMRQPVSSS